MLDRVPLQYPLYGATFREAVSRFRRKLFVFSGRASRSEFWWAVLAEFIVTSIVMTVLIVVWVVGSVAAVVPFAQEERPRPDAIVSTLVLPFVVLYAVVVLIGVLVTISRLGITSRRLHDGGFSALWMLLYLVPFGSYVVLALCAMASNPGGMRFDLPPQTPVQPVYGTDPDPSSTIRS